MDYVAQFLHFDQLKIFHNLQLLNEGIYGKILSYKLGIQKSPDCGSLRKNLLNRRDYGALKKY